MTFKDIAVKNFKAQTRKYLAYFLCSSFSIMIFFMYTTLLFNDGVKSRDADGSASLVFLIGITAIVLFSFFFITYAHTAFIRSRFREFGIYLALGIQPAGIRKMILLENLLIILSSFVAGLGSGLVFSRIFQMIVLKLLNIDEIPFALRAESFLTTIGMFAVLFACVTAAASLSSDRLEASELLKKASRPAAGNRTGLLPGLAGVLLLLASFPYAAVLNGNSGMKASLPAVGLYLLLSLAGVYICISYSGKTVLLLLKKNKKLYYRRILIVSGINQTFREYKKLLFVLSLLSSMIIFLVASPFSLLRLSGSIAAIGKPNHLEYTELGGVNAISPAAWKNIVEQSATPVVSEMAIEFISLRIGDIPDKSPLLHSLPLISVKTYNSVIHNNLDISSGQAFNIISAWEPGYHGIPPKSELQLTDGSISERFFIRDSRHMPWISGDAAFPSDSGLVISDDDYNKLKSRVSPECMGVYHIANFEEWERTGPIAQELKLALEKANSRLDARQQKLGELLPPSARFDSYQSLQHGYSMFVFVTIFLGILFFIAAGSVLYFKQFTDIQTSREKFGRLYKLGMTEKEMRKVLAGELKLLFFTPLLFGSILGISFIIFMTGWVGGESVLREFMMNAGVVILAYFIFQILFYFFTKSRYAAAVLEIQ